MTTTPTTLKEAIDLAMSYPDGARWGLNEDGTAFMLEHVENPVQVIKSLRRVVSQLVENQERARDSADKMVLADDGDEELAAFNELEHALDLNQPFRRES